jgi:hypothetical protein
MRSAGVQELQNGSCEIFDLEPAILWLKAPLNPRQLENREGLLV